MVGIYLLRITPAGAEVRYKTSRWRIFYWIGKWYLYIRLDGGVSKENSSPCTSLRMSLECLNNSKLRSRIECARLCGTSLTCRRRWEEVNEFPLNYSLPLLISNCDFIVLKTSYTIYLSFSFSSQSHCWWSSFRNFFPSSQINWNPTNHKQNGRKEGIKWRKTVFRIGVSASSLLSKAHAMQTNPNSIWIPTSVLCEFTLFPAAAQQLNEHSSILTTP